MADDSFTETVGVSWLSRIVQAGKGFVAGLIIIPVAGVLLFWNEGHSVTRYRQLNEAQRQVVPLPGAKAQATYEGKLVYLSGLVRPGQTLADPDFGINAEALKMQRVAEMYQWAEHSETQEKKKLGGGKSVTTTYTYSKVWRSGLISTGQFNQPKGHENPQSMPFDSATFTAHPLFLGEFTLGAALVGKMNQYSPLALSSTASLPDHLKNVLRLYQGDLYQSQNPDAPQIGDLRIKYLAVPPGLYSVMAKQAATNLEDYRLSIGDPFVLIEPGRFSSDALIKMAHASNRLWTWIWRGVGWLVMFLGIKLLAGPLEVVADFVPVMGRVFGGLTFVVSLLLAAFLSLLIISVAWIIYRPLLGAGLLVGSVAVLILMQRIKASSAHNAKIQL
jgi:hypothetical protein